MEKASFDRLNKLFVIFSSERHHQTLLIDQNLLVVVRESQLYILPILPYLAPKVLELDDHHTLNDLPFLRRGAGSRRKGMARLDRSERKEMLGGDVETSSGQESPSH